MSKVWLGLLLLWAGLWLAGCKSPVYKTEYEYVPVQDAKVKSCVAQCRQTRANCRALADQTAAGDRAQCEAEQANGFINCSGQPVDKDHPCVRQSCAASSYYGFCDYDYRECYQSCGGTVIEHKICMSNCPRTKD